MKPKPVVPRHVRACQHSADHRERWFVWTWRRAEHSSQLRVPYCCNSWRCPVCRRHEAAVTFARLREAQAKLDPRGWCMLVLTLDRHGTLGGRKWPDVNAAYRELSRLTNATLKRIGRIWGPEERLERSGRSKQLRTVRVLGNRWVAVVEAHRSGWPHVNLFVWCPELAEHLEAKQREQLQDPLIADAVNRARELWQLKEPVPEDVYALARKATLASGAILQLLHAVGWGSQSTAERARDAEAVLAYGVKLAGLHDASVGELAKITQAPLNAPERFRRLRAGKGFLPRRHHDPSVTGCLMRRRRSAEGDWELQAINGPKDEAQREPIEQARAAELQLMDEEERLLSRNRGKLPAQPPLRRAIHGQLRKDLTPGDLSEPSSALLHVALALIGGQVA